MTVTNTVEHGLDNFIRVKRVPVLALIQDIGWLVSMRIMATASVRIIQKMTGFAIPLEVLVGSLLTK